MCCNMKRSLLLIAITALLCSTAGAQDQRFENPPKEARPYVWWHWINGNTSKDGIRRDLEWMNRIGIAGFHQFDAGGSMDDAGSAARGAANAVSE